MTEELIGGASSWEDDYRKKQERMRARSRQAAEEADRKNAEKRLLRILVVDDQELVRSGFRLIMSSFEDISVVGEASDGMTAYELVEELHPDVVLMDIRMPLEDGIESTRRIRNNPNLADTQVLVLTTFDDDEYVYDALSAGASGFMLKDAEPDDIAAAVRVVAAGDSLIQPSITTRLIKAFVRSRPQQVHTAHSVEVLTDREREIMILVAQGYSNEDIAQRLVISPATVKTHVTRIMSKLGVHDRAQLVIQAYETGMVRPSE